MLIFCFSISLLLVGYWERIFIFINPGENGVLYRRFAGGTDLRYRYTEGLTVIPPWDRMYIYDVRDQQVTEDFDVLAKDGLGMDVQVSIRYRVRQETLPQLHITLGPDYAEKVVIPEIKGKLRYLMGQYSPDEIYRSQGLLIRRVVEAAAPELEEKLIVLDDLLLTKIQLPTRLQAAIEKKLEQEQSYLEYEFRLRREEQEKLRKEIEAEGIQAFQTIIETTDGSSFQQYLTYLGIQATLALSSSPNAKVVVIGGDKGLPLILNLPETPLKANGTSSATNHLSASSYSSQSPTLNPRALKDLATQAITTFEQLPELHDIQQSNDAD